MNSILNNPLEWGQYIPAPSDVDQKHWQERLDQVAGKNVYGRSIVRLVWGWSDEAREWKYGEWHFKYKFLTVDVGEDKVELATPRWFLEELYEPGQYRDWWEKNRWDQIEDGTLVEALPPVPTEGWYGPLKLIAKHFNDCCARAWAERRQTCWGAAYRAPGEIDIELVAQAVKARDADPRRNDPHEPIPNDLMTECMRATLEQQEKEDVWLDAMIADATNDFLRTHKHRLLTDDPSVLRQGRYHFMGNHSKSGMPANMAFKETAGGLLVPSGSE